MLINVNKTLDEFSKLVKEKKYDRIEYDIWRKLSKDYEADITYRFGGSDTALNWEGKTTGYQRVFAIAEKSFGKYLWDEVIFKKPTLDLNVDTTALSAAAAKANDAMTGLATAISSIDTTAIDEAWAKASNSITDYYTSTYGTGLSTGIQYSDLYTISDSTSYINQIKPHLHISQNGLYIDGKKIDDIIDEATGASVKRKENDTMDLFKGFDFGSCENDKVKVSMYGIAVQNPTGTWVSYDSKSGKVVDVDILNFSGKYLYKMPVAIKDVKESDVIIHNRRPMFVTQVEAGKILAIDPAAGEEKIILLTRSPFGFDFVTKIVNVFEGMGGEFKPTEDQPFGNPLMFMMLSDNTNTSNLLPFIFMNSQETKFNPLMFLALRDKNDSDNFLPLLFLTQGFGQSK